MAISIPTKAELRAISNEINQLAEDYYRKLRPFREKVGAVAAIFNKDNFQDPSLLDKPLGELVNFLKQPSMVEVLQKAGLQKKIETNSRNGKEELAFALERFLDLLSDNQEPRTFWKEVEEHVEITLEMLKEFCDCLGRLLHVHAEQFQDKFHTDYQSILSKFGLKDHLKLTLLNETKDAIADWESVKLHGVFIYNPFFKCNQGVQENHTRESLTLEDLHLEPDEHSGSTVTKTECQQKSVAKKNNKRRNAHGTCKELIISGITKHHQYENGSCLNSKPFKVRGIAKQIHVDPSSVTKFLQTQFNKEGLKGYKGYCKVCNDKDKLNNWLKLINGEVTGAILLGGNDTRLKAREEPDDVNEC